LGEEVVVDEVEPVVADALPTIEENATEIPIIQE